MQKNFSNKIFYVIALSAIEKWSNEEINMFVMEGDTTESWFTTTNIGEAFMFYNKDIAKDVANQLKEVLKDNNEFFANKLAILAVEFNAVESEEIPLEP